MGEMKRVLSIRRTLFRLQSGRAMMKSSSCSVVTQRGSAGTPVKERAINAGVTLPPTLPSI